jgi:hypothetical protein
MDLEFLKDLEESFSNVGTSEVWKREIGGRTIWFSPISAIGQTKISDTLTNSDLGSNVILESKRQTLAHAVVGIDEIDLRSYRFAAPQFPIIDPRQKKEVLVELPAYIYSKMNSWGAEFIDDAFRVFADLIESHKNENLKSVKFENVKDPVVELAELEARIAELRSELNMAPLVEASSLPEQVESIPTPPSSLEKDSQSSPPAVAFDPFATLQRPGESAKTPLPNVSPATPVAPPVSPAPPDKPPIMTVPVPIPTHSPRARRLIAENGDSPFAGRESSPEKPFQATPSIPDEVVEQPASRAPIAPPILNPKSQNKNPRFHPPGSR